MEIKLSQLRKNARRSLRSHWEVVAGVVLINVMISWLPIGSWWGIFLVYFLSLPFHAGMLWFYLDSYQGEIKDAPKVWDPVTDSWVISDYQGLNRLRLSALLRPFNQGVKFYLKVIGLLFFVGLFTLFWGLLLVVPGVIKSMSYSQALFVLKENPDLGIFEAINESRRLMNGQKKKYLLSILSMSGWLLIPAIVCGILFSLVWSGQGNAFSFVTGSFSYDFIFLPLYFIVDGNGWLAALAFITLGYYAFFYLPYYWTVLGGFYRELVGPPNEEDEILSKKSLIFPKVAVGLTAGLVVFSLVTADHTVFRRLRQELGIAPQDAFFYNSSSITKVDGDTVVLWGSREARVTITEATTIVIYETFPVFSELFDGLPLVDSTGTGAPAVVDLSPRQVQAKAQNWLEPRLTAGTATIGNVSEIEAGMWATIIGTGFDGDLFVDYIILLPPGEPVVQIENAVEDVSFLGATAAQGQFFDSLLNVEETYLYFPHVLFTPDELTDQLLMEWINQHREVTDYFSWVQLDLTNGHQLRMTNTLYAPPTLLYMQPDMAINGGWSILYLGEECPNPTTEINQVSWVERIGGGSFPVLSPLGREASMSSKPQRVPKFNTIAEYMEWANSLEWDLSIAVTNPMGQVLDTADLGDYTIQHVFGTYVGPGDNFLWIEVKRQDEPIEWVQVPYFSSIAEYQTWLADLGWGTHIFVYNAITGEELDPVALSDYTIMRVGGGPDFTALHPHHGFLWISVVIE